MLVPPKKNQYALRAIFELAKHMDQGPVKISDIAAAQSIPLRFLEVILNQLKASGGGLHDLGLQRVEVFHDPVPPPTSAVAPRRMRPARGPRSVRWKPASGGLAERRAGLLDIDRGRVETAIERIDVAAGQVYNVGGGPENTLSVWQELGPMLAGLMGREIEVAWDDWRPGDQRIFVADIRKAERELAWRPRTGKEEGVERLYEWVAANRALFD